MRFYLAISSAAPGGRAPVPEHVTAAARALARLVLPVPADTLRHDAWSAPGGGTALLAWTNEPVHPWLPAPLLSAADGAEAGVLGTTGYLADPADLDRLRTAADPGPLLDRTSGAFGLFRAVASGFDAVTSLTRTDPVYTTRAAGLHIAGNRAALVHLTARAAEEGPGAPLPPAPRYDIAPMQALVRHGFYISDDTPFAGVAALPELATLRVREGRAEVLRRSLPEPEPDPGTPRARRARLRPLAEALTASVAPVRRHDEAIALSLTGGRDSRLVAAVLHAAGIPFRATTRGLPDHPDVILAGRICAALGVADHRVAEPAREDASTLLAEHPLPRTLRLVRMTEGMNSAFENVISPTAFLPEARLSGSGGEALRGGWLNDQKDLDPASLAARLRTITLAQSALMTPEAAATAERLHAEHLDGCGGDLVRGLDRMFLRYRSGRWLPGSRTATLIGYFMYHPFLDHRVRWEAMRLDPTWRWSEDVVFRLIADLAPPLARLPVADRPWRFDHRRMLNPLHRRARTRRGVLRAATATGGFDWRRRPGPEYVALMRDRVLATPELFELVDRRRAEELLSAEPLVRPSQVWNLYTLAVLLSGEWLAPAPAPAPERVRVPLP
jgi:hypothetical protein